MDIDVTIFNRQDTAYYCDTEIPADFIFPPNILCPLCTLPDTNTKSPSAIDPIL